MLLLATPEDPAPYLRALAEAMPRQAVAVWPEVPDPQAVRHALVWNPPEGMFAALPNLRAVFNLGAGVDRLLARPDLPPEVPVIRLRDAGMARQMAEYALFAVLRVQRDMDRYAAQQTQEAWDPLPPRAAADLPVAVLGLGAIGSEVASTLAGLGYPVTGWSRSPRVLPGVLCRHGWESLDAVLAGAEVLIIVLPSTPETRGMLDAGRLARLPAGATVVACGRGDQIREADLLAALEAGHLRGAVLDVFPVEPLPPGHPLWRHPRVLVTPHVAAATLAGPAVAQIAAALHALEAGTRVPGLVDRARGY